LAVAVAVQQIVQGIITHRLTTVICTQMTNVHIVHDVFGSCWLHLFQVYSCWQWCRISL